MPAPYLPAKDADFNAWLLNMATLATAAPATYGLTAPIAVIITAQSTAFDAALTLATDPGTRTPATVAAKDATRATAEATVRPYAVQVSLNSAVLDEDKVALGVTVRKTVPTPVPAPTTRPGVNITSLTPGVVRFNYSDVDLPAGKAKPPGTVGMQIYTSVGTEFATTPEQCSLQQVSTKSPGQLTFSGADAGKKLTIYARWQTRGGPGGVAQVGPWSDRVTTIIA